MFLQQQVRFKLLHYISVVFACMADSDSDMPQATLLSVAAREANSRADATFAEMIGGGKYSNTPWRRGRAGDSTDAEEIVHNLLMTQRCGSTGDWPLTAAEIDAPAPSVASSALPSETAAAASSDMPCPLSMLLPIEWDKVRYYTDETGAQRYDTKNSPLPLPHPSMEFRGYVENDDGSASAFFTDKTRRGQPGTRLPKKRAGGVNKRFFDGLKQARTDDERAKYCREFSDLYIPHKKRFGPKDPEL